MKERKKENDLDKWWMYEQKTVKKLKEGGKMEKDAILLASLHNEQRNLFLKVKMGEKKYKGGKKGKKKNL